MRPFVMPAIRGLPGGLKFSVFERETLTGRGQFSATCRARRAHLAFEAFEPLKQNGNLSCIRKTRVTVAGRKAE